MFNGIRDIFICICIVSMVRSVTHVSMNNLDSMMNSTFHAGGSSPD